MENAINSVASSISVAPSKGGAVLEVASLQPSVGDLAISDLKEKAGLSVDKLVPDFAKAPELDASPLSPEVEKVTGGADQEMTAAVERVSSYLRLADTSLELRVDAEAGNQAVISIYDGEDGSLLRQYPTDEMLEIARKITEQMDEFRNSLINGGPAPSVRGLFTNTVV